MIVKYVQITGYCRICWKRFRIDLDVYGMTLDDVLQAVRYKVRCCPKPDLRLNSR